MKEDYFTAKEDMADIIDNNFRIRKRTLPNIARLYDDAMPCVHDQADRLVGEIHFYYLLWKKFGALPDWCLQNGKQKAETVLAADPDFFQISPDAYADLICLAKELLSAEIPLLTEENI